MSRPDHDLIRSGVERRIAAVESLIPAMPAWRPAADEESRPIRLQVVAGPALREAPAAGRGFGVLVAAGAVLLLMLALGLTGGGREPSLPLDGPTPTLTPTPAVSGEASEALGALRPVVEPRLTIPVRPASAWTVIEDGTPYLDLVHFLDDVGSSGYSVSMSVFEPRGVYDPLDETRRLPLPDDLIAWIRDHPDLEAGAPEELTVAGLPARAIDAIVTYRAGGPKGDTVQFIDDGIGSWNLEFPHKMRIVLVELPDRPLLVVFGSRPEFFGAGISQFDDELTQITFDERGPAPDP